MCTMDHQEKVVVGDSEGKIYLYCADTFDLISERKSMGHGVEMLATDDIHNIIYSFESQIVVINESLETVTQFSIDTKAYGSINFLKCMQNLIVVGTDSSTFLLLDSLSGEKMTAIKPKNWTVTAKVTFLRSQANSIRNLGGTDQGQLFTFDIN